MRERNWRLNLGESDIRKEISRDTEGKEGKRGEEERKGRRREECSALA